MNFEGTLKRLSGCFLFLELLKCYLIFCSFLQAEPASMKQSGGSVLSIDTAPKGTKRAGIKFLLLWIFSTG